MTDRSIQCDLMLHAYMYTQSGIPILYSGDEIGQENDYTYHENPLKREDSRYLHRGNMNWKKAEERHDAISVPGKIYEAVQKMIKLRGQYKVFETGADTWTLETYNDHVLAIGRYFDGEKLIALFNFSEEEQMAWINEQDGAYKDLFTGKKMEASGIRMAPYAYYWLYKKF